MNRFSNREGRLIKPGHIKLVVGILVIIFLVVVARAIVTAISSTGTDSKVELPGAKAVQGVSREFPVPIMDASGEEAGALLMLIDNAEIRDEIIVQGQRYTSIAGRSFLIINLKLVNSLEKSVEVSTKDYIRLAQAGTDEWLAPDIHNDPVVIQAISTKLTRVAFPVDDSAKSFVLQVGEITGDKERIEINFR